MEFLQTTDCPHIVKIIKGILLPKSDIPDTPIWGPSSNGQFTVKLATWLAHKPHQNMPQWCFSWISSLDLPPKLLIFLWQLCHSSSIGVRQVLHQWKILPFGSCPLCHIQYETIDHLFIACPSIQQFWNSHPVLDWTGNLHLDVPFV